MSFAAVPLTRSPDRKVLLPGPLPLHPQVRQFSGIYLWRAVRLTFSYRCEQSRVVHIQSCFYITRLRHTRLEWVSYTSSGLERCLSYSQAWSSEFKLIKIWAVSFRNAHNQTPSRVSRITMHRRWSRMKFQAEAIYIFKGFCFLGTMVCLVKTWSFVFHTMKRGPSRRKSWP